MTIIKNIKTDGELERFKAATGATGRFRLRGPRRNLREHQDASPEVATHGTLYHTKSQDTWFDPDKLGVSVWTHSGNIYKGDRFIFSRQEDALECLQSYLNKGWQGRMTEGVYQSSPNPNMPSLAGRTVNQYFASCATPATDP